MINKVEKFINKMHMIRPQEEVIVGLSGGADSVCLFCVLLELSKRYPFSLKAIHVEHGIRGEESRADAFFVEQLCREKHVPLEIVSVDVPGYAKEQGIGYEEAARILRYEAFLEHSKEGNVIALAHHMEDQAETVLFRMARGSGITGACGMEAVRNFKGRRLIRPLLVMHRGEIEKYLLDLSQEYRRDSTNEQIDYSRNRIRQQVIPQLQQINSQAVTHVCNFAQELQELELLVQQQTDLWMEQVVETGATYRMDATLLKEVLPIIRRELIYRVLSLVQGKSRDLSLVHVQAIEELLELQSGKSKSLPGGIIARREYDKILIWKEQEASGFLEEVVPKLSVGEEYLLQLPDQRGTIHFQVLASDGNYGDLPKNTYTKWFDYDKIRDNIVVRHRREGDFYMIDEAGHHQKLKSYFIDKKIPASERDAYVLIAEGQTVLWMLDGRTSEHLRVSADTRKILAIKWRKMK